MIEWIPITDRLPLPADVCDHKRVLITIERDSDGDDCVRTRSVWVCNYSSHGDGRHPVGAFVEPETYDEIEGVVAWAELPEPYMKDVKP